MSKRRTSGENTTNYQQMPFITEEGGIRYLHFASAYLQGAMRIAKPTELVWQYVQEMMAWLLVHEPSGQSRLGILGLGAGSLLRYCLRHTPAYLDVIEYNPAVTRIGIEHFKLPAEHERVQYWHEDAHEAMRQSTDAYDVLMVDLYDHEAKGPSCSSLAFYRACYHALKEQGVMTVNLFANHSSFERNLNHIYKVFKGACFALPETEDGNCIVLAMKSGFFSKKRAIQVQEQYGFPSEMWLKEFIASQPSRKTCID